MTADPIDVVVAALEANGHDPQPRGAGYRAYCPVHDDQHRSLDVDEGVDRRALIVCRAQACEWRAIMAAIGLTPRDLFPPGSPKGRREGLPNVSTGMPLAGAALKLAQIVGALQAEGREWTACLGFTCPCCRQETAWLRLGDYGLWGDCPTGCPGRDIVRALAVRAHDVRQVAA